MRSSFHTSTLILCALAVLSSTSPALALGDYVEQRVAQPLRHDACRMDTSIFDGERFVEGVPFPEAKAYFVGFLDKVNRAAKAWNGAPRDQRSSAEARALQAEMNEKIAWAKAMVAVFPALERAHEEAQAEARRAEAERRKQEQADKRAHDKICAAFGETTYHDTVNVRPYMERMILVMEGRELDLPHAKSVLKHRSALEAVAGTCADPRFVDASLWTRDCHWVGRGSEDEKRRRRPATWCEAATQADTLLRKVVMNHARERTAQAAGSGLNLEKLTKKEGWVSVEGFYTYEDVTTVTDALRDKYLGYLQPMFEAVGITDLDDLEVWDTLAERMATQKAAIDQLAPSWKNPPREASDYSAKLAKKAVKEAFGKVKGAKAWLSRKSWRIRTTALGVPIERTRPGYVQYRVPGEPWCQLRAYTVTEAYAGGGTYEKAGALSFGYTRWQTCR